MHGKNDPYQKVKKKEVKPANHLPQLLLRKKNQVVAGMIRKSCVGICRGVISDAGDKRAAGYRERPVGAWSQ